MGPFLFYILYLNAKSVHFESRSRYLSREDWDTQINFIDIFVFYSSMQFASNKCHGISIFDPSSYRHVTQL